MVFFKLCEHYDDDISGTFINDDLSDDICFICFEGETTNKDKPIYLKNQVFYVKTCICNGVVHSDCLKIWTDLNKNCPICRKKIDELQTNMTMIRYIPYGISIYIVAERMSVKFMRFLAMIMFLYAVLDMYVLINHTRSEMYNDYHPPFFIQNDTTSLS